LKARYSCPVLLIWLTVTDTYSVVWADYIAARAAAY
jgi:hypothetical protein